MRELSLGGSNAALVPEEGGEKGGLSQTQDRRGLIWGLLLLGLLRSGSYPQVNLLQLLHDSAHVHPARAFRVGRLRLTHGLRLSLTSRAHARARFRAGSTARSPEDEYLHPMLLHELGRAHGADRGLRPVCREELSCVSCSTARYVNKVRPRSARDT